MEKNKLLSKRDHHKFVNSYGHKFNYDPKAMATLYREALWKLYDNQKKFNARLDKMDKEMRREVGKPLRKAEKLVKKAEKSNAKLADRDEKVRDPLIAKCQKVMKKNKK